MSKALQGEVGVEDIIEDSLKEPWCHYGVTVEPCHGVPDYTVISGRRHNVLLFVRDYLQLASLSEAALYIQDYREQFPKGQ